MKDVRTWLDSIGYGQYTDEFEANAIDWDLLPELEDEDLEKIGVLALGHRKRILRAISSLSTPEVDERERWGRGAQQAEGESPTTEAERRQLTVMFCDLVGSTELSQQLDPEDLRELNRAYQDSAKICIERYGGYVARYMGDGVLAYFGFPRAHEDDAERAVRAGLDLPGAVADIRTTVNLEVRLGIATGPVVVGDLIGEGASQESAVVGATANLASRLQGLAAPGMTAICGTTHELVQGLFDCRSLGAQQLRGFARDHQAWEVAGERKARSRFEALRSRHLTPFIARRSELALLLDRWETATLGEGQVVLLHGEPGIGKSRLTEELRGAIEPPPDTVMLLQCSPHHRDSAYFPFISWLEQVAQFEAGDEPADRFKKLDSVVDDPTPDRTAVLSLLATLLSLPAEGYPPLDLDPEAFKLRMTVALRDQVSTACTRGSTLVIVEDVHWMDPTSLEVLDAYIEVAQHLPVLLVITHRPEFTSRWSARGFVTELHLNRLARRDGSKIIRAVAGANELPEEVAREILAKTDGIALFVEELTKAVIEAGSNVDDAALPSTLQGSLLARLDHLGDDAKHVAQVGAAIGREFRHSLLTAVADRPQASITAGITGLMESGLLFRNENAKDPLYTFKHALVRDAAYESLLHARRSVLHSQIVTALEGTAARPQERAVELLAYHAQLGGLVEKAITYSRLAGERANERSAYAEALEHLERGLRLGTVTSELPRPLRERLGILLALRPCLGALGDYERMLAALSEAREAAEALGEHELGLAASINRVHALYICGQIDTAVSECESALERTEALGNPRFLLSANVLLGIARNFRGELRSGLDSVLPYLSQLCGEYRHERLATTGTSSVNWLGNLGALHVLLGDFDSAVEVVEAAGQIAGETGKPFDRAMAGWWEGQVLQLAGRPADAIERLTATIALTEDHGMHYLGQWARKALGSAYVELGQVDRGHDELARSVHDASRLGVVLSKIWGGSELAHAATERGDFRSGIAHAESTRLMAARSGSWWMEGLAAQRLARAYALSGERRENRTEDNWLAALALFERCNAEPLIAHCERELGEYHLACGREQEARIRLSTALTRYRNLGVRNWVASTETSLTSLSQK